ncbi:hypothetical protein COF61_25205 [Bacillus toyonensis]|nr:hypothetical protein [Bacillus toyonensis]PHD57196.1 hypothetical protein COF61_25205 [Bacillus toyonensis]
MATGWEEINSKWYYFYENGEMAKDGSVAKFEKSINRLVNEEQGLGSS